MAFCGIRVNTEEAWLNDDKCMLKWNQIEELPYSHYRYNSSHLSLTPESPFSSVELYFANKL